MLDYWLGAFWLGAFWLGRTRTKSSSAIGLHKAAWGIARGRAVDASNTLDQDHLLPDLLNVLLLLVNLTVLTKNVGLDVLNNSLCCLLTNVNLTLDNVLLVVTHHTTLNLCTLILFTDAI